MDLGWIGSLSFDMHFVMGFLSIVLIDLMLAGDNAVVIAMAVRYLPGEQRRQRHHLRRRAPPFCCGCSQLSLSRSCCGSVTSSWSAAR